MTATIKGFLAPGLGAIGTLTAKLFPYPSGGVANGAGGDALTEDGSKAGWYTGTVSETLSGVHTVHFYLDGVALPVGYKVNMVDGEECEWSDNVDVLDGVGAEVWSYATRTLTSFAGLAGFGARTVVITVQTSVSVAIQGAIVRVTLSGSTYSQTTNSSGQVTFNLDDGTWTVAITKAGYSYAGTTIVVDGDETATYQMTTNSVSAPAAPNLAVGTLTCLGTDGLVEEDVDIVFRMTAGPGTAGYALDSAEFTETSDAAGAIEASFVQGATYTARRGTIGREVEFTAPASASFTLPEALGAP